MADALDTQGVWIFLFADLLLATLCYLIIVLTLLRRGRLRQQELAFYARATLKPSLPARFPAPHSTYAALIPERGRVSIRQTGTYPVILNIEPDDAFIADHRNAQKLVAFLLQETVKKAS